MADRDARYYENFMTRMDKQARAEAHGADPVVPSGITPMHVPEEEAARHELYASVIGDQDAEPTVSATSGLVVPASVMAQAAPQAAQATEESISAVVTRSAGLPTWTKVVLSLAALGAGLMLALLIYRHLRLQHYGRCPERWLWPCAVQRTTVPSEHTKSVEPLRHPMEVTSFDVSESALGPNEQPCYHRQVIDWRNESKENAEAEAGAEAGAATPAGLTKVHERYAGDDEPPRRASSPFGQDNGYDYAAGRDDGNDDDDDDDDVADDGGVDKGPVDVCTRHERSATPDLDLSWLNNTDVGGETEAHSSDPFVYDDDDEYDSRNQPDTKHATQAQSAKEPPVTSHETDTRAPSDGTSEKEADTSYQPRHDDVAAVTMATVENRATDAEDAEEADKPTRAVHYSTLVDKVARRVGPDSTRHDIIAALQDEVDAATGWQSRPLSHWQWANHNFLETFQGRTHAPCMDVVVAWHTREHSIDDILRCLGSMDTYGRPPSEHYRQGTSYSHGPISLFRRFVVLADTLDDRQRQKFAQQSRRLGHERVFLYDCAELLTQARNTLSSADLPDPSLWDRWRNVPPPDVAGAFLVLLDCIGEWFVYWSRPVILRQPMNPDELFITSKQTRVHQHGMPLPSNVMNTVTLGKNKHWSSVQYTLQRLGQHGCRVRDSGRLSHYAPIVVRTTLLSSCLEECLQEFVAYVSGWATEDRAPRLWKMMTVHYPYWSVSRGHGKLCHDYSWGKHGAAAVGFLG